MDSPLKETNNNTISKRTSCKDYASERIKHYIRSEQLQPGASLPTIRALSEHLDISRDSAWRALKTLKDEKWLRSTSNRRYCIADEVYSEILQSLRVRAAFTGGKYISFSGFRRLALEIQDQCNHRNLSLSTSLVPLNSKPPKKIWDDCDILLVASNCSAQLLKHYNDFPIPVIGLDADYSDRYRANIVTDHHLGGRMAAERLIRQNSRKACVVYFEGSKENPRIQPRIDGFRQAWLESGRNDQDLSITGIKWSQNNFQVALSVQQHLKDSKCAQDLFITNGELATTYLEVLDYLDVSIPSDIKLLGYDGSKIGRSTIPPMTTIQQDMETIARIAVTNIEQYSSTPGVKNELIRIAPTLIERDSG